MVRGNSLRNSITVGTLNRASEVRQWSIRSCSVTDVPEIGTRVLVIADGDKKKADALEAYVHGGFRREDDGSVTLDALASLLNLVAVRQALVPADASALYARNLLDFLKLVIDKEGHFHLNLEDDIVAACLMCRDGNVVRTNG